MVFSIRYKGKRGHAKKLIGYVIYTSKSLSDLHWLELGDSSLFGLRDFFYLL